MGSQSFREAGSYQPAKKIAYHVDGNNLGQHAAHLMRLGEDFSVKIESSLWAEYGYISFA